MTADGFSVKTAIAQMGNVARAQLKGQQGPQAAGQQVKRPGEDQSRVEQVRKTEDAQKNKLDPDGRQARDHRSGKDRREDQDAEGASADTTAADEATEERPGRVLDLKA